MVAAAPEDEDESAEPVAVPLALPSAKVPEASEVPAAAEPEAPVALAPALVPPTTTVVLLLAETTRRVVELLPRGWVMVWTPLGTAGIETAGMIDVGTTGWVKDTAGRLGSEVAGAGWPVTTPRESV